MSRSVKKWRPASVLTLMTALFVGLSLVSSKYQLEFGATAVHAASAPDLVVSSITNPPASAIAGTSFSVTDTTGNSGAATANASTTRYRLSLDNVITSADSLLTGSRSVPSLKKGASSSGSVSVTILSGQTPGTYYLGACADDTAVITESNETNNCKASTTTIIVSPPASITGLNPSSGPIGTPITINGSNFGTTQGSSTVTFNGATATPTSWGASSITVPVPASATTGPVVVTVAGVTSNGVTFTLTYSPRVNAGGSNYTDGSGNYWAGDRFYGSGPWGYIAGTAFSTSDPIANTVDDVLYQWVRYGTFGYKFDLPNGLYDVTLHFSEVGWTAPNQRLFNVSIEGAQVLTNYDIFAQVGHDVATNKTYYGINVQDGQLNIDFTTVVNAALISAIQILPARPTKLVITSVNSGITPTAGVGFPVIVQAQNPNGVPINATVATNVSLSVESGAGTVGGTISGTIGVGSNQLVLSGVTYSKNDYGVVVRAAATSGESLTAGISSPFNVAIGSPTKLGIIYQPANSTTSGAIKGPPTVAVQDDAGNTITTSTAAITIAIGTNPGGGALSGTTVKNASAGTAAFADLHINQAANGYTLTATSPSLTSATTNAFNITVAGSVAGTVTKSAGGGAINGALVEALQSGVVIGTASSNSSGSYTITGLVPGTYDIRGTAGGFTPQTQTGVTVNSGATATANFSLAVATPTAGIVYIYDELQRLKSVIDPVGEAATYAYDAVGNLLSITRNNATQTSIIDFNPNSGPVGGTVTIYGTGYSTTPSQNTVTFNGVAATVISSTLTQIVANVPAGATNGPIAVTSPAGGATNASAFTVTVSGGAPTLASFAPIIGTPTTIITLTGTNFDTTPANNEVRFNPTVALATTATSTDIVTTVPSTARSGKISVSTPGGSALSSQDFFVPPSGFTNNDVDFTGRLTLGGAGLVMSVNTANKIALALFEGVAGQRISLQITNSTIASGVLRILKPDGLQLSQLTISNGAFLDVQTLPMNGTYTISVDPNSTNTGQVTITIYEVPADSEGTITPGGTPVTVATTIPGQNAKLTFSGVAGQKVSLQITGATIPSRTVTIFNSPLAPLVAGQKYDVKMEIFDTGGPAEAKLWWTSPSTAVQAIPQTQLYPPGSSIPGGLQGDYFNNLALRGAPVLARTDSTVNFLWSGSPGGSVLSDNFSARWTGQIQAQFSEPYIICTTTDNGGRLWINGLPIVDKWVVQGVITSCSTVPPPLGSTTGTFIDTIVLPVAGTYKVYIDPSGDDTGEITLALHDVPADTPVSITIDGGPVPVSITTAGQNANLNFSGTAGQQVNLQMTGVTIPSSTVTIYNPMLEPLVAGQKYDVRMEIFDSGGSAQAHLQWSGPSTVEQAIPQSQLYLPGGSTAEGLQGDYFNNTGLSGAPALSRTDPTVDFTWSGSPGPGVNSDNFSARWTGQLEAQFSELYDVCTTIDNGGRLWINNLPVVDKWVVQGVINACSSLPTTLATAGVGTGGASINNIVLPVTGTYTINLNPSTTGIGNSTFNLTTAP